MGKMFNTVFSKDRCYMLVAAAVALGAASA